MVVLTEEERKNLVPVEVMFRGRKSLFVSLNEARIQRVLDDLNEIRKEAVNETGIMGFNIELFDARSQAIAEFLASPSQDAADKVVQLQEELVSTVQVRWFQKKFTELGLLGSLIASIEAGLLQKGKRV